MRQTHFQLHLYLYLTYEMRQTHENLVIMVIYYERGSTVHQSQFLSTSEYTVSTSITTTRYTLPYPTLSYHTLHVHYHTLPYPTSILSSLLLLLPRRIKLDHIIYP